VQIFYILADALYRVENFVLSLPYIAYSDVSPTLLAYFTPTWVPFKGLPFKLIPHSNSNSADGSLKPVKVENNSTVLDSSILISNFDSAISYKSPVGSKSLHTRTGLYKK